jgi:putative transposase
VAVEAWLSGETVGEPVYAYGDAALSAFELDFFDSGRRRRVALGAGWRIRFEDVEPVRGFRWNSGALSFPGWYYAATTRSHVGYESWLERDWLILLDFDPDVVGIASQPFWLHWHDGAHKRRHAPDHFVRLADGRARLVDLRAEDQVDERTAEAFAATQRACSAVGWEFRHVGVPDPVLMANVRWLARYRHPRCGRDTVAAEHLVEVFRQPRRLRAGAEEVGDVLRVLPVLFHLLWAGVLRADLGGGLLGSATWCTRLRRMQAGPAGRAGAASVCRRGPRSAQPAGGARCAGCRGRRPSGWVTVCGSPGRCVRCSRCPPGR